MKRIGLFGGSFDPPHLAHLALAQLARDVLALDQVKWIPAGNPWQKRDREITPAEHRRAMVKLMIDGHPRLALDDIELQRPGPSYTIDTVTAIAAEHPKAQLFLIIGQDQYARLDTWHAWRELLACVTLAVVARDGQTAAPPRALMNLWHRVTVLDLPTMPISATTIREWAARGGDITPLVGERVANYIEQHALYRQDRASYPSQTRS